MNKNIYIPILKLAQQAIEKYGSPLYLTDTHIIQKQSKKIIKAFSSFNTKIYYAVKANYNPHIINIIKESGVHGIDAVSVNEIKLALKMGYQPEDIVFTPSNASNKEIAFAVQHNILQNCGSLSELKRLGEQFPGSEVGIRICPEVGAGESKKVVTGQQTSKFGISLSDIDQVKALCAEYNLSLIALHSHIGSGFYDLQTFRKSVEVVCQVARNFPEIKILDFGGGFGVSYRLDQVDINLHNFAKAIEQPLQDFISETGKHDIEIRFEPGKFLVSQSTVLLANITGIKEKNGTTFVGLNAGFNNFIRPTLYDSYHQIVNLSARNNTVEITCRIVGNVCETGDIFNQNTTLQNPKEGDILAILVTGGYGASMSSNYNLREICSEVIVNENNELTLTREKQTFDELVGNFTHFQ